MEESENIDTVRLDVNIDIRQHDPDVDTGLTVEQWNALTPEERSAVYEGIWEDMTGRDNGGVRVVTPGAVGL